jgi:hypothetical protein
MKYRVVCRYVLLIIVVISVFSSCNSDDYTTGADEVSDAVKEGTWSIVYFKASGTDKTQNYEEYSFTFGNNTLLTATKHTSSYKGIGQ